MALLDAMKKTFEDFSRMLANNYVGPPLLVRVILPGALMVEGEYRYFDEETNTLAVSADVSRTILENETPWACLHESVAKVDLGQVLVFFEIEPEPKQKERMTPHQLDHRQHHPNNRR